VPGPCMINSRLTSARRPPLRGIHPTPTVHPRDATSHCSTDRARHVTWRCPSVCCDSRGLTIGCRGCGAGHAFGSMKTLLRGTPQEQLPLSKVQNPAQTSLPPQDAWFHRASRRRWRARRVAARSTQAPGAAHLSRRPAGGRLLPARYPARAVLARGRRGAGTCFATAVPAFHPAGTRGGRGPDPRRRRGGGRGSGSVRPAGSLRDRGRR
jgi:hypothetical protein